MARMLSLALAAFITAPIVAPSIGAVILSFASWRWIFGFLAVYGAVSWSLRRRLPRGEPARAPDPTALRPRRPARGRSSPCSARPPAAPGPLVTCSRFGTLTVYLANSSAVLMDGYGLDAPAFGAAFAVVAVCSSAGNLLNSRLVRRDAAGAHDPRRRSWRRSSLLVATAALRPRRRRRRLGAGRRRSACSSSASASSPPTPPRSPWQPHGAMAGSAAAALGFTQTLVPAADREPGRHRSTTARPCRCSAPCWCWRPWPPARSPPAPLPAATEPAGRQGTSTIVRQP